MSKEKLQEIRRAYSIDDKEYIDELIFIKKDIDELMELAYNQALEDVSKKLKRIVISTNPIETVETVDKRLILKLKIK